MGLSFCRGAGIFLLTENNSVIKIDEPVIKTINRVISSKARNLA